MGCRRDSAFDAAGAGETDELLGKPTVRISRTCIQQARHHAEPED